MMGKRSISARMRKNWREFTSAPPGTRFQRMHRSRDDRSAGSTRRMVVLFVGIVLMIAGVVLLPAPGPGSLVIALGAVMAARESAWVARSLDRCELAIRRSAAAARQRWRQASFVGRLAVGVASLLVVGVLGWAAYEGWQAWTR